jgi:hypothetical protein
MEEPYRAGSWALEEGALLAFGLLQCLAAQKRRPSRAKVRIFEKGEVWSPAAHTFLSYNGADLDEINKQLCQEQQPIRRNKALSLSLPFYLFGPAQTTSSGKGEIGFADFQPRLHGGKHRRMVLELGDNGSNQDSPWFGYAACLPTCAYILIADNSNLTLHFCLLPCSYPLQNEDLLTLFPRMENRGMCP